MHFFLVETPTLIFEIIADLKKKPDARRLPEAVVKALAAKMSKAHGIQLAPFYKLALMELSGKNVPMFRQVPVDASAPNVYLSQDTQGVMYDSRPEQQTWSLLAAGDFTAADQQMAAAWRTGLERVDLRATADAWEPFAHQHFGATRNLTELITQVDALLSDSRPVMQLAILGTLLSFLGDPTPDKNALFNKFLSEHPGACVKDLYPYAASIMRLYLTFVGGLARGFIGLRPSHYLDLHYLFYAPFCMVFVSHDKFHREMWGATSGINTFLWGKNLKDDLASRVTARKQMTTKEREAKTKQYGYYPVEVQGSVINDVWRKYMLPKEEVLRPTHAKTIEDLEPRIRAFLKNTINQFDIADS